ncbi:fasciclin [Acidovorax carolinensis]|uniref:Fasciclin n=1 Tax=Acidovorax carolinensis TaxID=553814 RepID=A0A240UET4_9BURK|nr:fasciclin domain-containing protein [Acidovorax carolinensis]ART54707.1 fasciclin [Acidovorax carolinensis]ART59605.1 fasciclin [Acidovorax carolinensis]
MFRRYALQSALALVAVTALGACATHTPAPQTLAETVAKTPSLQTFNALVAEAGMTETLKAAGPYTVFAPSDAAFKAVPAKTLDALKADKALLKSVISYHIVPSRVASADVKPGNVKTVQGATVALARAGTFVTVEDALVEQADIAATNGVIHVVDRVLMPPKK